MTAKGPRWKSSVLHNLLKLNQFQLSFFTYYLTLFFSLSLFLTFSFPTAHINILTICSDVPFFVWIFQTLLRNRIQLYRTLWIDEKSIKMVAKAKWTHLIKRNQKRNQKQNQNKTNQNVLISIIIIWNEWIKGLSSKPFHLAIIWNWLKLKSDSMAIPAIQFPWMVAFDWLVLYDVSI